MPAVSGGLSAQEISNISKGNVVNETASPASEQEDSEGLRETDGKLNDKVKKNIIEAFKGYPCLWNSTHADYKCNSNKTFITLYLFGAMIAHFFLSLVFLLCSAFVVASK